jgi:trimeric autotransporter adhesin
MPVKRYNGSDWEVISGVGLQGPAGADGTAPLSTKGQLLTRNSSAVTALSVGTNNQVLTADSAEATGLKWATPTSKIIQVVYGRTTTQSASSSGSYADTNLTATITPTSSSSSILVLVSQNGLVKSAASSNNRIHIRLNRGATALDNFVSDGLDTGTALLNSGSASYSYLDSPATTSATTYKTQFASAASTSTVYCQYASSQYSSITLMEIGA